ncbi:MAG: hypothetical protein DSM106950_22440 [Stigonema ocellatum SAG 48.90 = DSM 106950]|nr:hypothetical protein [Stigonema ocellatum SAG 48.90 = DSM 106950]
MCYNIEAEPLVRRSHAERRNESRLALCDNLEAEPLVRRSHAERRNEWSLHPHNSLLPTPYSPTPPLPHSPLPTPHSPFPTPYPLQKY